VSYAGSITAQLLRAAVAGRAGYKEGEQAGGVALQKAASEQAKETREALVAAAQAAAANRTAGLADPNDPEVLAAKERSRISGDIAVHTANRLTDVKYPTRDMSGSTPGGTDKARDRMRSAYKAKLMAPTSQRFGPPRPGMSEAEAEEITTEAWGPPSGTQPAGPDTSTRSLMGGSILRGGGAAAASRSASTSSSSKGAVGGTAPKSTSSAPANDPKLNVSGGKKTGNIDLSAAPPAASAIPTGANLKERDMDPADLWDKKVREGMTPVQATAYVKRLKGTG
jgi:hypothetical protein